MGELNENQKSFLKKSIILFNQTFAKELKQCEHCDDYSKVSPYHAEGDIYTHTMMVLRGGIHYFSAIKHANNHYINEVFKALVLACLLHDVGKPVCKTIREEKNKDGVLITKTYFTGHEKVSADMSINFLNLFDLEEETKNACTYAILYHTVAHKKEYSEVLSKEQNQLYKDVLDLLNHADEFGRIAV